MAGSEPQTPRIGVVALQGDVAEHARALFRCGVEAVEVRSPEQIEGVSGIIVPGGESTTIGRLMMENGLLDAIRNYYYTGGCVWGTCAGMVLVGSATTGPRQPLLGLMNALVERNAFGRQVHSFETDLEVKGFEKLFTGIFIRAPYFDEVGPGVEVLSEIEGKAVAARGERILATAFHPELAEDDRFHKYFIEEVCEL